MNFARRGQLYDTWQRLVMQRAPFIWLIDPTNHFAYRTNVHNFTIQSTVHLLLWPVWKG
jgi:ABC-type transport system substrate-binding protein